MTKGKNRVLWIFLTENPSPPLDMRFVQNFTPPDFQAKTFTPSISPNFNSFSDKYTKNKWKWNNLHRWQKFYTDAGSGSMDKSYLCLKNKDCSEFQKDGIRSGTTPIFDFAFFLPRPPPFLAYLGEPSNPKDLMEYLRPSLGTYTRKI